MKVCNITAMKQASYISNKENKKNEIKTEEVTKKQNSAVDMIQLSSTQKQEIQDMLVKDEKYQQIQFQEREKKYPIINRFSDVGVAHDDKEIHQMQKNFWKTTKEITGDFLDGKATVDDIMNYFCDITDEAFEKYTEKGYMGDFNSEKTALLNQLYRDFRFSVNSAVYHRNIDEGKQYCEFADYGYHYYNADYYYKAKELTDAVEQEVMFVAEEKGIENYTAPTDLQGYYKDLNSFIFDTSGLVPRMLDTTKEPPKDFKFFWQEESYKLPKNLHFVMGEDGKWHNKNPQKHFYGCVVKVWSGENWYGEAKVPFKGNLSDIKKVSEIFQKYDVPKEIKSYLSNLQIFSLASESLTYWKEKY